jgi:hypothetical protein
LIDPAAMRTILMYAFFLFPVILAGQDNRCLFHLSLLAKEDSIAYKKYLSLIGNLKSKQEIQNRTIVYLPVVIHVVAHGTIQPISVAQATQQLDVLNADFAGRGENIPGLSDAFVSIVGDAQMQFCLATVDPDGQPTTGITFTMTDIQDIALQTGWEGRKVIHYDQLGGKSGWDASRYINIWVGEYGGVLGSATFPGMAPFPEEIGLTIDPRYFGSIGDAGQSGFFSGGHTLTHEIGHFFGLNHIWGNDTDTSCDDSDFVEDTPNAAGPYYNCPSGEQESCGTNNMYRNFMDFTDDRCLAAFTQGQVMVMQAVREAYYSGLVSEAACFSYAGSYTEWYDQLIWSHDASSDTYVIYNPDAWPAAKKVRVYSADGKIILEDKWEDELSYLLDLGNVASGVYFVRIAEGDDQYVRKVVVY